MKAVHSLASIQCEALVVLTICLFLVGCKPPTAEPLTTAALRDLDLESAQKHMESGALTAVSLTQYYLDRIEELDDAGPMLNAVLEVNPGALDAAAALDEERKTSGRRGLLHGIPVLLKANIDTRDSISTTAGSLALAGHRPGRDAFFVARLREAGAVILGMGNLSEWANFRSSNSTSGWSSEGGQTRNPFVLDRGPCGSSSGPAVAVSADLTLLGVGTETDGSVMCPSGINGIVGIKPTLGLVSRDGIIPIAHSQDTAGPMARTVKDAAALLQAMVARDPDDPASVTFPDENPDYVAALSNGDLTDVRIGVWRDYSGAEHNPEVEALYEAAIHALRSAGAEIVDPTELENIEGIGKAEGEVLNYEFKNDIRVYLEGHGSPNGMSTLADLIAFNEANSEAVMPYFGQERFLRAEKKGPLTDRVYLDALDKSKTLARGAIDGALDKYHLDALIAPTNGPARKIDLENGDDWSDAVSSSSLPAVSGYPNVTVPMGFVDGLPVGLSIFGAAYSEETLLRIAYGFEQATNKRLTPEFLPGGD